MMKCSTLTLTQEAIHGLLFPVTTESVRPLVQNFIIRFQHVCQNFSHGGLCFLYEYIQSSYSEYLTFKMKAVRSFKTPVTACQTGPNIPRDFRLHSNVHGLLYFLLLQHRFFLCKTRYKMSLIKILTSEL